MQTPASLYGLVMKFIPYVVLQAQARGIDFPCFIEQLPDGMMRIVARPGHLLSEDDRGELDDLLNVLSETVMERSSEHILLSLGGDVPAGVSSELKTSEDGVPSQGPRFLS